VKAVRVAIERDFVQSDICSTGSRGYDIDSVTGVVTNDSVSDVELQAIVVSRGNAISGKAEDNAILDVYRFGLKNVYPSNPVAEAINRNTPNCDYVSGGCVDDNARG
jgi:hypothetical protein